MPERTWQRRSVYRTDEYAPVDNAALESAYVLPPRLRHTDAGEVDETDPLEIEVTPEREAELAAEVENDLKQIEEEMVKKTVSQQKAKRKTKKVLEDQGLPVPPDLKAEVDEAPEAPEGE